MYALRIYFSQVEKSILSVHNEHMTDYRPDYAIRLETARIKRGFTSARAAAQYFGWVYETYIQHENGTRGIGRSADRYAKAFRVSEAWLLTGEGDATGNLRIPLISWISAGKPVNNGEYDEELGTVGATDLPEGDWVALRVTGDSMDRISPPDSIIFVDTNDKQLIPNGLYVIDDGNGNATYKRYRPGPPERFEPVSTNPDLEPIFYDQTPTIIGRVRRTILDT